MADFGYLANHVFGLSALGVRGVRSLRGIFLAVRALGIALCGLKLGGLGIGRVFFRRFCILKGIRDIRIVDSK